MKLADSLSDRRGNRPGISIFMFCLKVLGVNRACEMVWPVALCYALFDRRAAQAVRPYIRHRFPNAGSLERFWHRWAIYVSQGQSLIERIAERRGQIQWQEINPELTAEMKRYPGGYIMLTSHFGAWHAQMGLLSEAVHPVNVLLKPDQNRHVDKTGQAQGFAIPGKIISTLSPLGGLPEAFDALSRHELVCLMGDRCYEDRGIRVRFLGEEADFPTAAFFLAARSKAPILPLFSYRTHRHRKLTVDYGPLLYPKMSGRSRETLRPWVEEYVRKLEVLAMKYPHQCFIFENIWQKKPVEKIAATDTLS